MFTAESAEGSEKGKIFSPNSTSLSAISACSAVKMYFDPGFARVRRIAV